MYSQLKSDQSSNGFEKPWSMDLITRRSKRRSSILGKGRTSLRLSVAGTIPSVVTSPGKNVADKSRVVTSGAARKPISDDVLRHFARTNGINPSNPFANQLKESVGSGQSLDENEQEAVTSCSAPSSSSEGSARKEDPDITGVFFMDDVESVKKRQQLDANTASSQRGGVAEKGVGGGASHHHHLVPCNLMTRSPFAAPFKEPLKDQALRLNRDRAGVGSRTRGLTSSSSKRRTIGESVREKPARDYPTTRQPVLSPVAPVLSSDYLKSSASSLSLSSSLSSSLRGEPENVDCAPSLRKSLSTTDLSNRIVASGCSTRDARRAASEMHFEEMCKTRCESVGPTNISDGLGDLFVSKGSRTNVRSSDVALDQTEGRTLDRQNNRPTSVRSSELTLNQMQDRTQDRQNNHPTSVLSSELTLHQTEGRTHIRSSDHQSGTETNYTTDSRSASKSRGRYSVALYTSDSNNMMENHTKKSRPSIMSDLIINHKNKYGGNDDEEIFSKKENNVPSRSKHADEILSAKKVSDVSGRSMDIDDLLKRIDLSVKANRYTDDESPETDNIDDSSSKIVNDELKNRGVNDKRMSKFVDDDDVFKNGVGIDDERSSKFVNDDDVVKNRGGADERSSKFLNDDCNLKSLNGDEQDNEKEVCSKFNRTLNFDDDNNDRTFIYNESICNKTLLVDVQTSAGKIKKLSVIEEDEVLSRMSSANESDASLLESTIRGGNISVGSTELGGKMIGEKMAAILDYLQKSQKEFNRKQVEFVEQLKGQQNEFVKRQNEQIEAFERYSTVFQQEQTAKLAALCEDVANPTTGDNSSAAEDEVFHTAQKKPLNEEGVESNDCNAIYSSLKSDFKCLKTPNARSNKKAPNLNKTILTPHSMSVCVQEQVSMLFDALD